MKIQLQSRLTELKSEFEKGQQRLQQLEQESTTLRQTLLRIAGAVQVLEEELAKFNEQNGEVKNVKTKEEIGSGQ